MRTILIIVLAITLVVLSLQAFRTWKFVQLQKKRNDCDLSTEEGRNKCKAYNIRINKLMNHNANTK